MISKKIALVDYGVGNIASLMHLLKKLGHQVCHTSSQSEMSGSDLIILPGVGAFPTAMGALNKLNLVDFLQAYARNGRPLIGICLGMQLLANSSEEFGYSEGLGIVPGRVIRLSKPLWHIGWNNIDITNKRLLSGSFNGASFYFNHSYYFECSESFQDASCMLDDRIPTIISNGKVVGIQFHPEKSQEAGRRLLEYLVKRLTSDD